MQLVERVWSAKCISPEALYPALRLSQHHYLLLLGIIIEMVATSYCNWPPPYLENMLKM